MAVNIVEYIKLVRHEANKVAGEWNGDESGSMEDKARCAMEIIDKCDELIALLDELSSY